MLTQHTVGHRPRGPARRVDAPLGRRMSTAEMLRLRDRQFYGPDGPGSRAPGNRDCLSTEFDPRTFNPRRLTPRVRQRF